MSLLHVANGHATTGLIELSAVPGRTMVWCDPLYDGPVPSDVSDDELVRVRGKFLASSDDDVDEVIADLRNWRSSIDRQDYDELVLWYEHDLFDQLNLIQILTHIGGTRLTRPVTLVSTDSFPGHPDFKGIGELEPADIAVLFEMRKPITNTQIALGERAWRAYRSEDPRELETLLATDTSALPYLSRALRRHLEEFPSAASGLSKSEQRMMEQAIDGPVDLRLAFPRMHDNERGFYITDMLFVERAQSLADSVPPLLTLRTEHKDPRRFPDGEFELTTVGRQVLNGSADRVRLCGIDRWLGGVHLTGTGPTWRWSAQRRTIIDA
jgi:hypothetical protein